MHQVSPYEGIPEGHSEGNTVEKSGIYNGIVGSF